MSYWLLITSPHNYTSCMREGLWGDVEYDRITRLKVGDTCIFYLTSCGRMLGASVKVVSRPRRLSVTPWWDRHYPWVVDVEVVKRPTLLVPAHALGLTKEITMGFQGRYSTPITKDQYDRFMGWQ